jgi:dTDP-4-dehydrorhamnose reductase
MLGTDLCHECNDAFDVYGVDIAGPPRHSGILRSDAYTELDITDRTATVDLIKALRPDLVIHAAAYTDVDKCEEDKRGAFAVNAEGTRNVALGCREADALLFYISTDFVFDGNKGAPYRESDAPHPLSVYGASKLQGEMFVRETVERFSVIRSSWLFGKQGKNFIDTILEKASKVPELKVVSDQVGAPTYTVDLATALVILAERTTDMAQRDIYHITNSGSVSWFSYAEEILARAGNTEVRLIPITSAELDRPAKRPAMSVLDNRHYEEITGNRLRNYREALQEYMAQRRKG